MSLYERQNKLGNIGVDLVINDLAPHVKGYRILDESIEANKGLYDIEFFMGRNKTFTVEIKYDNYAIKNWDINGRVYIETQQYGKPSCLEITKADFWAIVVGELIYYISTTSLKELCKTAEKCESTKYDTKGYYIYRKDLEDNCINIQDIIND